MSLKNVFPQFKVHNIQVNFGRYTSSISPSTCTALAPSKLIRSNNYLLGPISSIMTFTQPLIKLEFSVFPTSIWSVQSKISQTATRWWVPCTIVFINGLFLNISSSHETGRPNTSDFVNMFLICLFLVVECHTSRISPIIVSLEIILYFLGILLDFKMMSTIYIDSHVLKGNPLLNIKVPISMSRFFILSQNRKIFPLEIKLVGLDEGESEIDNSEA